MKRLLLTIVVLFTFILMPTIASADEGIQPIPMPILGLPDPAPHYGELIPVYGVSPYGGSWWAADEAPRAEEMKLRTDGRSVLRVYDLKNTFDVYLGYTDGQHTEPSVQLLGDNEIAVGELPYGSVVYLGQYHSTEPSDTNLSTEACWVNNPDGTKQYRLKIIDHVYNTSLMVYLRDFRGEPKTEICTIIGDAISYP